MMLSFTKNESLLFAPATESVVSDKQSLLLSRPLLKKVVVKEESALLNQSTIDNE